MTLTFRCNESWWASQDNVNALRNQQVEIVDDLSDEGDRKYIIAAEVDGNVVSCIAFADELIIGE